jgi:hypothetical protein
MSSSSGPLPINEAEADQAFVAIKIDLTSGGLHAAGALARLQIRTLVMRAGNTGDLEKDSPPVEPEQNLHFAVSCNPALSMLSKQSEEIP